MIHNQRRTIKEVYVIHNQRRTIKEVSVIHNQRTSIKEVSVCITETSFIVVLNKGSLCIHREEPLRKSL